MVFSVFFFEEHQHTYLVCLSGLPVTETMARTSAPALLHLGFLASVVAKKPKVLTADEIFDACGGQIAQDSIMASIACYTAHQNLTLTLTLTLSTQPSAWWCVWW